MAPQDLNFELLQYSTLIILYTLYSAQVHSSSLSAVQESQKVGHPYCRPSSAGRTVLVSETFHILQVLIIGAQKKIKKKKKSTIKME